MCIATHTMTHSPIGNKDLAAHIPVSRASSSPTTTDRKLSIRHASVADGSKIRSRFLNRIGITSRNTQRGKRVAASCSPPSSSSSSSLPSCSSPSCNRPTICSSSELLKKDGGKPDESLGPDSLSQASFSPSSLNSLNKTYKNRQYAAPKSAATPCKVVSFANAVEVIPIPSHRDYSDRLKNTFWTNKTEMQHMYARNVLEYTAENWDYRQVLEEDQFYRVVAAAAGGGGGGRSTGTELVLVHPIHFHVQRQQQQQRQDQHNLRWRSFCAVMSAQQKYH